MHCILYSNLLILNKLIYSIPDNTLQKHLISWFLMSILRYILQFRLVSKYFVCFSSSGCSKPTRTQTLNRNKTWNGLNVMYIDCYFFLKKNSKSYYTVSLFWWKYTRMFVPRFPGIPERRREIKHLRDSRKPRDKRSGIFPEKQWNNCYVTFYSCKRLKTLFEIQWAT